MECQILFSGENKKNISICCQLKILPRVLRVTVFCLTCEHNVVFTSAEQDKYMEDSYILIRY